MGKQGTTLVFIMFLSNETLTECDAFLRIIVSVTDILRFYRDGFRKLKRESC